MLEINNLSKSFKKKKILDDLTLSMPPGTYGFLGPNGAGKTTFIRCLTNLYKYNGEILYKGVNIKNKKDSSLTFGYLPQKFGIYRELTCAENLKYFCEAKAIPKIYQEEEIVRVLNLVNLSSEKNKKGKNLSGGMLRRLGIAQALLGDPSVLLFDEPTAGLDPEERLRFKMIVSQLPKDKIILISTHIVEDVDALCDNIIVLDRGNIKYYGSAKGLRQEASEKVYCCIREEKNKIQGKYYIEKQFERNGQIMYRLVSNEPQSFQRCQEEIEDGYICILEEI